MDNINKGWEIFSSCKSIIEEFKRQGINILGIQKENLNNKYFWKLIDNKNLGMCPNYPNYFVVPYYMKLKEINDCSLFRTKKRLPALVFAYKNPETQEIFTLWRSSQNKVSNKFD